MLFRNRNLALLWLVNITTTFAIEIFTIFDQIGSNPDKIAQLKQNKIV